MSFAFELDNTSTYLRNRDMHIYYQKLNKIIHRKKTFLPKLTVRSNFSLKKNKGYHPLKFATHSIYEKYAIERDNKIIFNKLNKINSRSRKSKEDEAKIQKYLDIKKNTREGVRKIQERLLKESNIKIKAQLDKIKPVLNTTKLQMNFRESREYFNNLKKLKPSQSISDIYLTKNESNKIEKYFDLCNYKNMSKTKKSLELEDSNKKLLKKLGH